MSRNQRAILTIIPAAIVVVIGLSIGAQQPVTGSSESGGSPSERSSNSSRSIVASSTPAFSQPRKRPTVRQRTPLTETEILSGINLTGEQKSAIDRIHHEMRTKMEVVSKDDNESPEQKAAMLEGMNRIQLRQVFDVLKPDQQEQVRRKILAMRSATRQEKTSPQQTSH